MCPTCDWACRCLSTLAPQHTTCPKASLLLFFDQSKASLFLLFEQSKAGMFLFFDQSKANLIPFSNQFRVSRDALV